MSSYGYDDDSKRKRRYVVISISSVLLISMVVAVTVGVSLENTNGIDSKSNGEITPSVKAVKDICAPTDYKKTCEDTLIQNGNNTTDPMELVKTAFRVTMKKINDAVAKSETMIELQRDPRTKMALDQCKEVMDYALGELSNSFDELGKFEFHKIDEVLINLRIWLSAAISHEETCLDGFQGTEGDAGETMKKALKIAIELTHNGLAIISEISNFLGQVEIPELKSRRLLAKELPSWLDQRGHIDVSYSDAKPDIVVAQDGSGDYTTINEAMKEVPKKKNTTFVVYIKEGIYNEFVQVNKSMMHLVFIGDGPEKTIITGNKNYKDGITTYRTATVAIVGDYFIAKNIGFENTAGAIKHQAVAVRVQADMSIFYNCRFDGYQDTLYTHSKRQFFRDCTISGTIDFLFGDSAAVFQNCTLLVRKPLENQACPITAHGRKDPRESTGFVFQGCRIDGAPDYLAVKETSRAYLGRPWKEYSRTIIMDSFIPDFVRPQGWQPWQGEFGLNTLFYSEVQNMGPGAVLANRVTWSGIKTLSEEDILNFTPSRYIQGDLWIPGKGVPYTPGFLAIDPTIVSGFSSFADTNGVVSFSPVASPKGSIHMAPTEAPIISINMVPGEAPVTSIDMVSTGAHIASIDMASTEAHVTSISMAPTEAPVTSINMASIEAPITSVVMTPIEAPVTSVDMSPIKAPVTSVVMTPIKAPITSVDMAPIEAPVNMAPSEAPINMAPTEAPITSFDMAPTEAPITSFEMAPIEAPDTSFDIAPAEAPVTYI